MNTAQGRPRPARHTEALGWGPGSRSTRPGHQQAHASGHRTQTRRSAEPSQFVFNAVFKGKPIMPPIRSAHSPATQLSRSSPRGGFPFHRQSRVLYHYIPPGCTTESTLFVGSHGTAWILQYGTAIQLQLFGLVCRPPPKYTHSTPKCLSYVVPF